MKVKFKRSFYTLLSFMLTTVTLTSTASESCDNVLQSLQSIKKEAIAQDVDENYHAQITDTVDEIVELINKLSDPIQAETCTNLQLKISALRQGINALEQAAIEP